MNRSRWVLYSLFTFSTFFVQPVLAQITTVSDKIKTFDGLFLDVRIDTPTGYPGKLPVLIVLQGSGTNDVDGTIVPPGVPTAMCMQQFPDGTKKDICKTDSLAGQLLASQGLTVVRVSKRGTYQDKADPYKVIVNNKEHQTSTIANRLKDVETLVSYLGKYSQLDLDTIYLYGISEGSLISTQFASKNPKVKGLVLVGAVLDHLKDLLKFQLADVYFDVLLAAVDKNQNQIIESDEYDLKKLEVVPLNFKPWDKHYSAIIRRYRSIGIEPGMTYFDVNKNNQIEKNELLSKLEADLYEPFVKAVEANDESSFRKLLPGYEYLGPESYRGWFDYGRNGDVVLGLNIPVSIFIGSLDNSTPTSQLDWFVPLAKEMKKLNIYTEIVPNEGHNGRELLKAAIVRIKTLKWGLF